jgi:hypothetical protein
MLAATDDVMAMTKEKSTWMRMWAYVVSLKRILESLKIRKGH